jgi:hypothetical protein
MVAWLKNEGSMNLQKALASTVVASIIGNAAGAVGTAPVLVATSKWQMEYAPAECRLLRTFGEGQNRVTLQFSLMDINDRLEMALAGPQIPTTKGLTEAKVSTTTVTSVRYMLGRGFAATEGGTGIAQFRANGLLATALRSDAAANRETHLGVNFARYSVQLDLGPMKGAVIALDKCMENLTTNWGLDLTEQQQLTRSAKPTNGPADWFLAGDYPVSLSHAGLGAGIVARLLVGEDGKVRRCAIAQAAGDKAFQDVTCRLLTKRALFRPALGRSGTPIASVWISRVIWHPETP